jgi:hypothetical protein
LLSGGTTFSYTSISVGTVTDSAPSIANTASHAVLTGISTLAGTTINQKYDNGVITVSIAPSGTTADNNFLPAFAGANINLDLTLVASGGPYRLKPLADGTTVGISWTCSAVNQATYQSGI